MNAQDEAAITRAIASLGTDTTPARFYAESDGGYCGSEADCQRTHYVCHTRKSFRLDCASAKEARELAAQLNAEPTALFNDIKAAGVPFDNHYSDLYFPDTPETRAILDRYPTSKVNAKRFTNQAPPNVGQRWIDVPFAFLPYWDEKQKRR